MLIEMQAGDLKYRVEITELMLAQDRLFGIKHHICVFLRVVMNNMPNTVRDFTLTLPHGGVKKTKNWPVNEDACDQRAAQWLAWIEEDLK